MASDALHRSLILRSPQSTRSCSGCAHGDQKNMPHPDLQVGN